MARGKIVTWQDLTGSFYDSYLSTIENNPQQRQDTITIPDLYAKYDDSHLYQNHSKYLGEAQNYRQWIPSGWHAPLKAPEPNIEDEQDGAIDAQRSQSAEEEQIEENKSEGHAQEPQKKKRKKEHKGGSSPDHSYGEGKAGGKKTWGTSAAPSKEMTRLYELAREGALQPDVLVKSQHYLHSDSTTEEVELMKRLRAAQGQDFQPRPHQREGIGHMMFLESSRHKGGILGDDMGLGKTLQAICLTQMRKLKLPTLVIVPKALLRNWEAEFHKFLSPPPRILIYASEGNQISPMSEEEFEKYEIVITSYSRLLIEYQNLVEVYSNFRARRSDYRRTQRIILDSKKRRKLVKIHHHRTSFPLFATTWGRLILDESHRIRNRKTSTHAAAVRLDATFRWALTGTPFANDYGDVQAIFRFLRIWPFIEPSFFKTYFLRVKRNRNNQRYETPALHGIHGGTLHLILNAVLIRRLKTETFDGQPITGLSPPTIHMVPVQLSNTDGEIDVTAGNVNLRERIDDISYATLRRVRKFFEWCEKGSIPQDAPIEIFERDDLEPFTPLTEQHGQYFTRKQWNNTFRNIVTKSAKLKKRNPGGIPREDIMLAMLKAALHSTHFLAPTAQYAIQGDDSDPTDQVLINAEMDLVPKGQDISQTTNRRQAFRDRISTNQIWRSTKINEALKIILHRLQECSGKVLVFSRFVTILDVMDAALSDNGVKVLRFDGSCTEIDREATEKAFQDWTNDSRVMLVQSSAGGEGLNLTEASTVVFITLEWTPTVQEQCLGRAYRIGQTRPIKAYIIYAKSSIDLRLLEVQALKEKKNNRLLNLHIEGLEEKENTIQVEMRHVVHSIRETWTAEQFYTQMETARVESKRTDKDANEEEETHGNELGGLLGLDRNSEDSEDSDSAASDTSLFENDRDFDSLEE